MTRQRRRSISLLMGGFAAGGVIVSHFGAYFAAAPDAHERAALLGHTGHDHWGITSSLMVGILAWALVRYLATSALERTSHRHPAPGFLHLWARLVPLQVSAFVAMEAVERVSAHDSLTHLFNEPAVAIGIALQALVAVLGALLLTVFVKVVETILTTARRPRRWGAKPVASPHRAPLIAVGISVGSGGPTLRGPPLTLR